ncbi:hypothetical protein Pfo_016275 [Paulownia fortunei]|nr:hypothetical protein Pfo_016275 [Paulownia fortunei]
MKGAECRWCAPVWGAGGLKGRDMARTILYFLVQILEKGGRNRNLLLTASSLEIVLIALLKEKSMSQVNGALRKLLTNEG